MLGRDVEAGLIPSQALPQVERMVADICHDNARRYFGF